jgi:hypothetical protein
VVVIERMPDEYIAPVSDVRVATVAEMTSRIPATTLLVSVGPCSRLDMVPIAASIPVMRPGDVPGMPPIPTETGKLFRRPLLDGARKG